MRFWSIAAGLALAGMFSPVLIAVPITPDVVKEVFPRPPHEEKRLACLMALQQLAHTLPLDGQFAIYGDGHTTTLPGIIGWHFIDFAGRGKEGDGLIVDVGAAFGVTTRPIAVGERDEKGVELRPPRPVIAIDRSEMNLDTLFALTPTEAKDRITAWVGTFPSLPLEDDSVRAMNFGSLLHFFPGVEIPPAMRKVYAWMQPGGKIFIEAQTPFLKSFNKFLPEYRRRVARGYLWPGEMNAGDWVPERKHLGFLNLFDLETLERFVREAGFIIEKSGYFWRHNYPADLAGERAERPLANHLSRDPGPSVGIVARKPLPGEVVDR